MYAKVHDEFEGMLDGPATIQDVHFTKKCYEAENHGVYKNEVYEMMEGIYQRIRIQQSKIPQAPDPPCLYMHIVQVYSISLDPASIITTKDQIEKLTIRQGFNLIGIRKPFTFTRRSIQANSCGPIRRDRQSGQELPMRSDRTTHHQSRTRRRWYLSKDPSS